MPTYTYRANGLRHQTTITGLAGSGQVATRIHVWDGDHIVLELNNTGAAVNRFYRNHLGHLIKSEHHGWYLFNFRGDIVQRADSQGNILRVYKYDAFGILPIESIVHSPSAKTIKAMPTP